MLAAGAEPGQVTEQVKAQLVAAVAAEARVHPSAVAVRVVAASLLLIFEITSHSAAAWRSMPRAIPRSRPPTSPAPHRE